MPLCLHLPDSSDSDLTVASMTGLVSPCAAVYNKGSAIIRIYDTLLGQDGFRRGMVSTTPHNYGACASLDPSSFYCGQMWKRAR